MVILSPIGLILIIINMLTGYRILFLIGGGLCLLRFMITNVVLMRERNKHEEKRRKTIGYIVVFIFYTIIFSVSYFIFKTADYILWLAAIIAILDIPEILLMLRNMVRGQKS